MSALVILCGVNNVCVQEDVSGVYKRACLLGCGLRGSDEQDMYVP